MNCIFISLVVVGFSSGIVSENTENLILDSREFHLFRLFWELNVAWKTFFVCQGRDFYLSLIQ